MKEINLYIAVIWLYTAITLCLVTNRLYVRATRRADAFSPRRPAIWSDAFVVFAWVFFLGIVSLNTFEYCMGWDYGVTKSGARKFAELSRWMEIRKIDCSTDLLFWPGVYCIKGSFLLFYLEITPPGRRLLLAIYAGLFLAGVGGVFCVIWELALCPWLWWSTDNERDRISSADCANYGFVQIAVAGFHIFTDLYVYILPFFIIRHAAIKTWPQRLAIYSMFGAGFLVILTSIPYIIDHWHPIKSDTLWSYWRYTSEHALSIMVACMPALRTTLIRCYHALRRKKDGTTGKANRTRTSFAHRIRRGELTTIEVANAISKSHQGYEKRDAGMNTSRNEPDANGGPGQGDGNV